MPPQPDPERSSTARRTAIRNILIEGGQDPEIVERWCDAWEAEAALNGIDQDRDYWQTGKRWIDAQCAARKQPPN